jgi:hypothetical protein
MWIRRGKKISPIFIPARRGCGSGLDYWQGPVPSRKIRRCEPTVGKVRGPCPGHDRWLNTVGIRKVVLPIRRPTRCGSAIVGWHGRSIILCWILVRKGEKRNRQNKRLHPQLTSINGWRAFTAVASSFLILYANTFRFSTCDNFLFFCVGNVLNKSPSFYCTNCIAMQNN